MKEPVLKTQKYVKTKKIAGVVLSTILGANSIFFGTSALVGRKNTQSFLEKYKTESKAYADYVIEEQSKAYQKYYDGEFSKAELDAFLGKEPTTIEIVHVLMNNGEQAELDKYNSLVKKATVDEATFIGSSVLTYATAKLTSNYFKRSKQQELDENELNSDQMEM